MAENKKKKTSQNQNRNKRKQVRREGLDQFKTGIQDQVISAQAGLKGINALTSLPRNVVQLQPLEFVKNALEVGKQGFNATKHAYKSLPNLYKGGFKMLFNHPEWYGGNSTVSSGPGILMSKSTRARAMYGILYELDVKTQIANTALNDDIAKSIASFNRTIGFETGLTVNQVITAIHANAHLASAFMTALRFENSKDLKISPNLDFSSRLTNLNDANLVDPSVRSLNVNYASKGNRDWEMDIIRNSVDIRLSPNMAAFIEYHYGNFFVNDVNDAHNAILEFVPTLNTNSLTTTITNGISSFRSAMSANMYIGMFMDQLGFVKPYDTDSFRRNMSAEAPFVSDPTLIGALANRSNLAIKTNKIVLPVTGLDVYPLDPDPMTNLSIGELGKAIKFNVFQTYNTRSWIVSVTNGSLAFVSNSDRPWNSYATEAGYRIGFTIDGVSGTNLASALNLKDTINGGLKSIPVHEILGFTNMNSNEYFLEWDNNDNEYIITTASRELPVGFDGYIENDIEILMDTVRFNVLMPYTFYDKPEFDYSRKVVLKS